MYSHYRGPTWGRDLTDVYNLNTFKKVNVSDPVWRTSVQRRCTGVWGWSGRTCWAPWPQAEAWSPWATPVPSSSLCTHPRTVWQCPPLAGGWGRNKAPPWSTWPTNQTIPVSRRVMTAALPCAHAAVTESCALNDGGRHILQHSIVTKKQFTTCDLVQVKDGGWSWP